MTETPSSALEMLGPETPTFSQLLNILKRSTLSVHNRLTSIRSDAAFISHIADTFPGRPLVANERCGSWYIPPHKKGGSAYFKSTDGHERTWKFSTRRLNLHLLEMIEEHDGIIIIDSTRRGKRMPDALSITIPTWCTVLNQAYHPNNPLSSTLHLPPYIPPQTHSAITSLLPSFLTSFRALNILPVPTTSPSPPPPFTKPLRPFWITQDSILSTNTNDDLVPPGAIFDDYRPVICCTASRRVTAGTEADEAGYIQGAADDTENWAHGLTPAVFWNNVERLCTAAEADLPTLITTLVGNEQQEQQKQGNGNSHRKRLTDSISVCAAPLDSTPSKHDGECQIVLLSKVTPADTWIKSKTRMEVGLGRSKTASRNLRLALPHICAMVLGFLSSSSQTQANMTDETQDQIVVACESGKNLSVGASLAISCYLFDDRDQFRLPVVGKTSFSKPLIRTRLAGIMTAYPEANPSRNTLQAVNSFLMDGSN